MKNKNDGALRAAANKRDMLVELVPCPACENNAILSAEVDYDHDDGNVWPIGAFVSSLKCFAMRMISS
jgi:hypothetical protein